MVVLGVIIETYPFETSCMPYAETFSLSVYLKFRIAYLQNHLGA